MKKYGNLNKAKSGNNAVSENNEKEENEKKGKNACLCKEKTKMRKIRKKEPSRRKLKKIN